MSFGSEVSSITFLRAGWVCVCVCAGQREQVCVVVTLVCVCVCRSARAGVCGSDPGVCVCVCAGQREQVCVVVLVDDSEHEEEEEFRLVLGIPSGQSRVSLLLGQQQDVVIHVTDEKDSKRCMMSSCLRS